MRPALYDKTTSFSTEALHETFEPENPVCVSSVYQSVRRPGEYLSMPLLTVVDECKIVLKIAFRVAYGAPEVIFLGKCEVHLYDLLVPCISREMLIARYPLLQV